MLTRFEKKIAKNSKVLFFLNRTQKFHPPGFEGLSLYEVIVFFYRQVRTQNLIERAAAISYNFMMAVPPSLLFIFTLIPHLPFISMANIRIQLHSLIYDVIPAREYNEGIIDFVDSFIGGTRIGLLSFGLLFSLFFASNAVMGLMRAFNKNYHGFEKRKGLQQRWVAIKLTILIFSLVLTYILLMIFQGNILKLIVEDSQWRDIISYGRWVLMLLLIFFAIAFVYKFAPAVEKRWKIMSPGTILATFLSVLTSFLFSIFVSNFGRYNALYGSIGTIMVVMALIFINSLVILIGFELNVSIKTLKSRVQGHSKKSD